MRNTFTRFRIREEVARLGAAEVLTLPDEMLRMLKWIMRQGDVSLAEISSFLKRDEAICRKALVLLVERGYVKEIQVGENISYKIPLASRRRREVPFRLWKALGVDAELQEKGK